MPACFLWRNSNRRPAERDHALGEPIILERCLILFKILQDVGKAVPLAGGPISGIAGVACDIIEVVQKLHDTRVGCANLAEMSARLALAVTQQHLDGRVLTIQMTERLEHFSLVLSDIVSFISKRLSAKSKWYSRLWELDSLQADLDHYTSRLEEAYKTFNITTLIDVQNTAANITAHLEALTAEHSAMGRAIMIGQGRLNRTVQNLIEGRSLNHLEVAEEVDVIKRTEFELVDTICEDTNKVSLHHAEYYPSNGRKVNVIVKIYLRNTNEMKNADLRKFKSILHPHTHSIIGQSSKRSPSPYLIMSDYTCQSARSHLEGELSFNEIHGFMSSISMLAGVASALHYLSNNILIGKRDLERCMKVESLFITPTSKVIVGRDLFTADPDITVVVDGSLDLSEWLKSQFWRITMELLFGGPSAIDWAEWESVQTVAPHVRPILTLTSHHCPTFALMSERLTGLVQIFKSLQSGGKLTYAKIRGELLKLPFSNPNFILQPKVPLDVAVGDIGYMDHGAFVKLDNIAGALQGGFVSPDHDDDYVRASGVIVSEDLGDGVLRHTFEHAAYAETSRWRNPLFITDTVPYWPLFLEKAIEIIQLNGDKCNIAASDLLFVTGVGWDYRSTTFTFDLNKGTNQRLPDVQLVEYTNADPDKPWAEWIIDMEHYSPDQFTQTFERHPQLFNFVQLEKGEC